MLDMIRSPVAGFEEVIKTHFRMKRKNIISTVESWIKKGSDSLKYRSKYTHITLFCVLLLSVEAELSSHLSSSRWSSATS